MSAKSKIGWLARRREKRRAKRDRASERAYQESREGLPKQGGGVRRRDHAEGGHFDSGMTGGGLL
jgi:hypothetical protein